MLKKKNNTKKTVAVGISGLVIGGGIGSAVTYGIIRHKIKKATSTAAAAAFERAMEYSDWLEESNESNEQG
jgi:hypothetical protein